MLGQTEMNTTTIIDTPQNIEILKRQGLGSGYLGDNDLKILLPEIKNILHKVRPYYGNIQLYIDDIIVQDGMYTYDFDALNVKGICLDDDGTNDAIDNLSFYIFNKIFNHIEIYSVGPIRHRYLKCFPYRKSKGEIFKGVKVEHLAIKNMNIQNIKHEIFMMGIRM